MTEQRLDSDRIHEGHAVNLRVDTIRFESGTMGRREVVERDPAVVVAAVDPDKNLLLVRQYRRPVEERLLELPAGRIDPGESPEGAVHRELAEETGYRTGTLRPLGAFYSAPSYCTELLHLFLATDLAAGTPEPEEDESIESLWVSLDQVRHLIHSGDIRDGKSIAGIYRLLDYLETSAR